MFILTTIETTSRDRFDLSQAKHVNATVVSLLNAAIFPSFPKGLTSEIKLQIMQQQSLNGSILLIDYVYLTLNMF